MGEKIRLLHSIHKSKVAEALQTGLMACSSFADLGLEMRHDVVYCWLRNDDDKMSSCGQRPDHIYLEVTVDRDRCVVADMDLASIAMMYRQGSGGKPENPEASRLLAEAYRVTSVPMRDYTPGMFWTPEILVKGDIAPDSVRIISGESQGSATE